MQGLRVGVTAARRGQGLVTALERRGASVLWGPTLAGDRTDHSGVATADLAALLAQSPSWFVASTGAGVRALVELAERTGSEAELRGLLRGTRLVARGAKAHAGLRSLGVEPVFVSRQETDRDTATWLARHILPGDTVGILVHGGGEVGAYGAVADAGGTLIAVRPYRSPTCTDTSPAERLIAAACDGGLDAVVCMSPGSVRSLVTIAEQQGRHTELVAAMSERVAVAVVGPVTASAVEAAGARVNVMPVRQRTADLINAVDAWASRGAPVVRGPITIGPEECTVVLPGRTFRLGEREFNLVAALVRRPWVACRAETLAVEVWGSAAPADAAAVKHLVSRVRRKLGPFADTIQSVRAMGYRYQPVTDVTRNLGRTRPNRNEQGDVA